ncbi:MAG: CPBP family intramembrane metalloprotease [Candidatus Moranbacteria bacterium]|nr:CPBP family intramembrane metalloprotease [Candidatus Moranbacteria bacterium]
MGYLGFAILLGLQAVIFSLGQTHWGVWKENQWLTPLSSAYLPFLTAFIIGWNASIQEEILYRLFGIHWIHALFHRLRLHPTIKWGLAVLATSLIWGLAHTNYPVFPLWFRGLEVTLLGIFLGYFYLRFGLICVLVSHYVFDVFWGSLEFLFSPTINTFQVSTLIILGIPGIFALIAFMKKKHPENQCKSIEWKLSKIQLFNARVLTAYLTDLNLKSPDMSEDEIKNKILQNGWDRAVVETVFSNIRKEASEQNHLE